MKSKPKKCLPVLALLVLCLSASAFGFQQRIEGIDSIGSLRSEIVRPAVIDRICNGKKILKAEARQKRMAIASEFETKFEDYKLQLRKLGDEIISLNDLKQNMRNIDYWKARKKDIRENFKQKTQTYLNNNADIYIPVVYAAFIELPIDHRHLKYQLIQKQLLTDLIEGFGIERIFSRTEFQNNSNFQDIIRTKQRGAMEQDGIRNFEFRDLVHRTPAITKCLTVGFYRFKPFARSKGGGRSQHTVPRNQAAFSFDFDAWNLVDQQALMQMQSRIKKEFAQYEVFLDHLDKYMASLGDIAGEMDRAKQRIAYVVQSMKALDNERKNRLEMADLNIERLEAINKNLMDRLSLSGRVSTAAIDKMIANKKKRRMALEKNFEYRFVIMAESDESVLETAVKNAMEVIFDDLDMMIEKQTMTIETVIANGALKAIDENLTSYRPDFKNIYIQQYFAGQNAGVILVLDVKYGKKKRGSNHSPPPPPPMKYYIENAGGMHLKMIQVSGDQRPFFISESEITKAQFYKFLANANISPSRYFSGVCQQLLKDYPGNYPMLKNCIGSGTKINGFLQWLNRHSRQPYRYLMPAENHYQQASGQGIYPGRSGFRVISRKSEN